MEAHAPVSGAMRLAMGVLLLLALGLRLGAATNPTLRTWDEAHHALVAKNLLAHPGHPTLFDDAALPHDDRDWQRAHTWVHKPPLTLWTMALGVAGGGATPLGARWPSAVLDTLAVLLTFLLARRLLEPRAALFAAAAHALLGNALLLVCGFHPTDHVDLQLSFWVELSAYCAVRAVESDSARWKALFALATGAALLTKSFPGLLIVGVYALTARGPRLKRVVESAAIAVAAFALSLPWFFHLRANWPELQAMEAKDQLEHLWTVSQGHEGHPLFHLEKLGEMHGVLAYLPVGWFLWQLKGADWRTRFVAAWWLFPLVLFSLSPTKMMNYLAPAAPAVCLMVGAFLAHALGKAGPWRTVAFAVTVALLVATGRDVSRAFRRERGAVEFREAMAALPPKTVLLNVKPFLQAMYFGAHAAYPEVWTAERRAEVTAKGYEVQVACSDDGPSIPKKFCERENVALPEEAPPVLQEGELEGGG
jgi:4-amino-4-deoxy-L-arabinose transferase-like glycosyltransferase